jgi:hypothetical protein
VIEEQFDGGSAQALLGLGIPPGHGTRLPAMTQ